MVEQKKQKWREEIAQVRREIEILKKNVDEFEQCEKPEEN